MNIFSGSGGMECCRWGEKQRPLAEAYVANQKLHHEQQTTNSWLERVADVDEGIMLPTTIALREPDVLYVVGDDFPF